MSDELEKAFWQFARFGKGNLQVTGLDSSKFSKMMKESGVIDKQITRTDVDLAFQKVVRSGRQMGYEQFQEALTLLAKKKGQPVEKLNELIVNSGGPRRSEATKPADDPWIAKQTDPSKYTGMHKYRFDQEGKGRGLAGRVSSEELGGRDLSKILDRSAYDVRGLRPEAVATQKEDEAVRKRIEAEAEERRQRIANQEEAQWSPRGHEAEPRGC